VAQRRVAVPSFWAREQARTLLLMLLPSVVTLVLVVAYPTFSLVHASLQSWNLFAGERTFVGLSNFETILRDPIFRRSLARTSVYTVACVSVEVTFGFALGAAFNRELRGVGFLRTLLIAPLLIAPVATGLIWRFMYEPSIGVVNQLLEAVGFRPVLWISSISLALFSVGVVEVWQWTPFAFLVLLAGMQAIPESLDEAAQLDGASWLRRFWYVQRPLLMPLVSVIVLIRSIDVFRTFDLIYVMTRGGPGNATYLLSFYNYVLGFTQFQMGTASAAALLIMLIAGGFTSVLLGQLTRMEVI
jgi:multiple sugar transport system permease protein